MQNNIAKNPSQLKYPCFLMNFPFSVDNDEPNNTWMNKKKNQDYNYDKAFSQFMDLYHYIAEQALVYILLSDFKFQDQVFVANLGCYLPHIKKEDTILLANFKSKPRVGEEQPSIKFFKSMGYKVIQPPFKYEGEADLKFIRDNIYIAGYGIRTDIKSHRWMEDNLDMKVISIKLEDEKLYHWDCSFFPLTESKALVSTKVLSKIDIKAIENIVEIIDIPEKFIYNGWTNVIRLGNKILHAPASDTTGKEDFKKFISKLGLEPIIFNLSEYEKSGADLSCMIFHLNYNNRDNDSLVQKSKDFWWAERINKLPKQSQFPIISSLKSSRVDWWMQNNLIKGSN